MWIPKNKYGGWGDSIQTVLFCLHLIIYNLSYTFDYKLKKNIWHSMAQNYLSGPVKSTSNESVREEIILILDHLKL